MLLHLWTDGSASKNVGGYAVIDERTGKAVKTGVEFPSTNIRMEGMAILEAMKYANGRPCIIHTDSQFWIDVLTRWAKKWMTVGWKKRRGKIANSDIVQEAYSLFQKRNVGLAWVKGHADFELNNLADEAAVAIREAYQRTNPHIKDEYKLSHSPQQVAKKAKKKLTKGQIWWRTLTAEEQADWLYKKLLTEGKSPNWDTCYTDVVRRGNFRTQI